MEYTAKLLFKGDIARRYDQVRGKRYRWYQELNVVREITGNFKPESSILDVAIGTGRFLPFYAKKQHVVYGIDISKDMLQQAKIKLNPHHAGNVALGNMATHLINGDAENIPLPDKSINYVICIRLLNLTPKPIFINILNELRRVTVNGVLVGLNLQLPMTIGFCTRWILEKLFRVFLKRIKYLKLIEYLLHKKTNCPRMLTNERKLKGYFSRNVNNGNALIKPGEFDILVNKLGMTITKSYAIDEMPLFSIGKIKAYTIFFLRFKN